MTLDGRLAHEEGGRDLRVRRTPSNLPEDISLPLGKFSQYAPVHLAATGDPVSEQALPRLVDDFVVHYGAHIADASVPFPGVIDTLTALKAQSVPMGVLTNKPHELALPLLDALDMSRFFGAIHGAGRFSYVKPDPRVFHHVVEELTGSATAPALMVGDSTTDAKTARAAKVPVILLSYGYTPDPVETLGADALTGDFRDIPRLARELLRL